MNNDTSDGGATVPCISLFDITDLCQREGIELRGDDGQPYCCGERMNVRGGIIGPDFAECRKCGKAIGNAASPHINGGCIPSDEWIKENGNKTWYVLHTSNPTGLRCAGLGAHKQDPVVLPPDSENQSERK